MPEEMTPEQICAFSVAGVWSQGRLAVTAEIKKALDRCRAEERAACAELAEHFEGGRDAYFERYVGRRIADAINARGNAGEKREET
jgi:hypothetical protein